MHRFLAIFAIALFASTSACNLVNRDKGDEASARTHLQKFLAPGADYTALTKPLRPTKKDYEDRFDAETAPKVQAMYDAEWDNDPPAIQPKPEQTDLLLYSPTTEELKAGVGRKRRCT